MRKAIFLDKDGTLVRDIPYNVNPELIQFETGVIEALKAFIEQGYLLIVVSNQSGVARGYFIEQELNKVVHKIQMDLGRVGVSLDGFFFCPHHPEGTIKEYAIECSCRKPNPGLILRAASEFNVDVSKSWMVGDILNDVEAGNRAGCRTVLVNNGNETEWVKGPYRQPTFFVPDFPDAAKAILTCELTPTL